MYFKETSPGSALYPLLKDAELTTKHGPVKTKVLIKITFSLCTTLYKFQFQKALKCSAYTNIYCHKRLCALKRCLQKVFFAITTVVLFTSIIWTLHSCTLFWYKRKIMLSERENMSLWSTWPVLPRSFFCSVGREQAVLACGPAQSISWS